MMIPLNLPNPFTSSPNSIFKLLPRRRKVDVSVKKQDALNYIVNALLMESFVLKNVLA